MKKSILNITALKKNTYKKPLNYYIEENSVTIWNTCGTFCIKCSKILFELEIQNNIPTNNIQEPPEAVKNVFNGYVDAEMLIHTFITYKLQDKNAYLFQNKKYKYISPIDTELLKIINNIADFTAWQYKANTGILFRNDFLKVILFPLRNDRIKENIIELGESLK